MEIKFEKDEVSEILKVYVKEMLKIGDKKIDTRESYGDFVITVSDWPADKGKAVAKDIINGEEI